MLKIILEITAAALVTGILLLFVCIDLIHDYCRKYVDNIEDKQIEIE